MQPTAIIKKINEEVENTELGGGLVSPISNRTRPLLTITILVFLDLLSVVLVAALALIVRGSMGDAVAPFLRSYYSLLTVLICFPIVYALLGLYPGAVLMPPEELRRFSLGTSIVFLILANMLFVLKQGDAYSRGVFLIAWLAALVVVPFARMLLRRLVVRRSWWGQPVIVLGAGEVGATIVKKLNRHPRLGLKPVALLDDDPATHGTEVDGVPVVGKLLQASKLGAELHVSYVMLAMPRLDRHSLLEIVDQHCGGFSHQMVIPDLVGLSSLWVSRRDLDGTLGLEIKQQLLLPGPRIVKRAIDIGLVVVLAFPVLAVTALLALLIRLDSRGPVFYAQERIGSGGRQFRIWKFRTMILNADKVLKAHLEKHPELLEEWMRNHKIKNDPRITRIGKILRRTSLDELPQLWNVVKGEMSLVGPRPIVHAEAMRYERNFKDYIRVRPGITGLWQVSGRNDTTYDERIGFDLYYVRNWSPWLDIYILVRTFKAVLSKGGAY